MHASNKPQDPRAPGFPAVEADYRAAVLGLWHGALGTTVRCVPTRRTVRVPVRDGWLFGKWRVGERARGVAEWRWLHVLPLLGLRTPRAVAWIVRGNRSLLVTAGLPGRPIDAWVGEALAHGWLRELGNWAGRRVAPAIRALHDAGLVYRDLYWNHVFATDPRQDGAPAFLDVERVFAPRWRLRRWVVKDLAGLLASAPATLPARVALRFLREYLGDSLRSHRRLLRAIAAKAVRIRARSPRYG